jgi:hypothetical protein
MRIKLLLARLWVKCWLWTTIAFMFVTFGTCLWAISIPAKQVMNWLKTGAWSPRPLYAALDINPLLEPTSWAGLNQIILWLLDTPAALWIALAGMVPLWLTFWARNEMDDAENWLNFMTKHPDK